MLIFKIFETYYQIASQKDYSSLTVTSSVWEHEHNPQWWVGWNRKPVGLERSGKRWDAEMSERPEEGFGRDGQEGGFRESSGLSSHGHGVVTSSVSDRHVETRSTEDGDMKSQRTFISSRKAEGCRRILRTVCWNWVVLATEDESLAASSGLFSQSLPDGSHQTASLPLNAASFGVFLLLFEFLLQRMCQFPHKNVFKSFFYFLTRYFCKGLVLVRILTFSLVTMLCLLFMWLCNLTVAEA